MEHYEKINDLDDAIEAMLKKLLKDYPAAEGFDTEITVGDAVYKIKVVKHD